MAQHVAFLRAINVGGRFLKMTALADHVRSLGHRGVQTFINSGNVIFDSPETDTRVLGAQLQAGLAPLLGFTSEAFVRTVDQVHTLAARTAALSHHVPDGGDLMVVFVPEALSSEQAQAALSFSTEIDRFDATGPELLWLCHRLQSGSTFSGAALERKLRQRVTMRRAGMLQRLSAQLRAAST